MWFVKMILNLGFFSILVRWVGEVVFRFFVMVNFRGVMFVLVLIVVMLLFNFCGVGVFLCFVSLCLLFRDG